MRQTLRGNNFATIQVSRPAPVWQPAETAAKTPDWKPVPLVHIDRDLSTRSDEDEDFYSAYERQNVVIESTTTEKRIPLHILPPEVLLEILDHLEYPDIRNVRNTAHFYRQVITPRRVELSVSRWKSTLVEREAEGLYDTEERQPCFKCLRLRHWTKFPSRMLDEAWQGYNISGPMRVNPSPGTRACLDCIWPTVRHGRPVWIGKHAWAKCVKCYHRRRVYHLKPSVNENYMCHTCGRSRVLYCLLPIWALQIGEVVMAWLIIAWAVKCKMQGQLTNSSSNTDMTKTYFLVGGFTASIHTLCMIGFSISWLVDSPSKRGIFSTFLLWNSMGLWIWLVSLSNKLELPENKPDFLQLRQLVRGGFALVFVVSIMRSFLSLSDPRK